MCSPGRRLASLGTGNIAVGHVRYGTTGSDNKRNVQPILVNPLQGPHGPGPQRQSHQLL